MAKYTKITDKTHSDRPIQVESAIRDGSGKNIENNYAKQNGYYQNERVGLADNLASDRQIDNPETACPPITMGITGGEAEIKSGIENFDYLEGKSIVFNQMVKNGNFANTQNWSVATNMTFTVNNNVATIGFENTGLNNPPIYQDVNIPAGHKYLVSFDVSGTTQVAMNYGGYNDWLKTGLNASVFTRVDKIITKSTNGATLQIFINKSLYSSNYYFYLKNFNVFDLTLIYGAGNEPTTVADFKKDFPLDYYAYNSGSILSAKTNALISRGRQQWDEEWEEGVYNTGTGEKTAYSNRIRCKNFIPVIPNTQYYFKCPALPLYLSVLFYDENYNYIDWLVATNNVKTTPANCRYITFGVSGGDISTYNHDITISIYFADGEGYSEYYPYSQDSVALPNIELRAIGDIKDIAYASGGGKRRLAYAKYDGSSDESWVLQSINTHGIANFSIGLFHKQDTTNSICNILLKQNTGIADETSRGYRLSGGNTLFIRIESSVASTVEQFKTWLASNNVEIVCELATETELTENTGWDNTINVDNYGTLQFTTDPQQVPQVEQPYFIKYTVNLGEWIDSAYVRTSGDADSIALLEDVEQAQSDIESELVGGQLVPSKSLSTKQIDNVSTESGSTQDTPFINQGTGTANGSAVVDTSPVGKHLSKQGNSVVRNQIVKNPTFTTTNNWTIHSGTVSSFTVSGGVATVVVNTAWGGIYTSDTQDIIANHKYLAFATISTNVNASISMRVCGIQNWKSTTTTKQRFSALVSPTSSSSGAGIMQIICNSDPCTIYVSDVILVDLTQYFGSNANIPQDLLDHPENWYRYDNGSNAYNTGTLVDSDGQYLECGGRNVWDEQYEIGKYIGSTGAINSYANAIMGKNYIRVNPNTQYKFYVNIAGDGLGIRIAYYDKDNNFIDTSTNGYSGYVFTTPANCIYIKFSIYNYGNTYKNDITISLYYTTGDGYDQYYPYEQPKVYDTGTETLRSAGSVRDYKDPDGTVHRLVAEVDLSTLTWTTNGSYWKSTDTVGILKPGAVNTYPDGLPNMICSKYETVHQNGTMSGDMRISAVAANQGAEIGALLVYNGSTTTEPTGILHYELVNPTTEEGTPFSENIEINDYGTMAWLDSENAYVEVPQGCEIFYPADYVLFVDSLGQREDIEWDAEEIVSQTQRTADKTAQSSEDTLILNAIGGTLRQMLAEKANIDFNNTAYIDLGTCVWYGGNSSDANKKRKATNSLQSLIKPATATNTTGNILCTYYKTISADYTYVKYLGIAVDTGGSIIVYDPDYADDNSAETIEAFKLKMKHVLLAYEKA